MGGTITEEERTVAVNKVSLREETVDKRVELKIDRIHADRGDTVSWDVGDRVVSIWFPDSGVFVTPLLAVQHRGTIEATIRSDAANGLYEYVIYDHTERRFVTCESHPKLEIPKP
jgi:hypothetical protein